jgi:hypothetical protein
MADDRGERVVVVRNLLTARIEAEGGLLRVRLEGTAAGREPGEALGALLDRLLARARTEERTVVLHFERLVALDWAGIAALARFFRAAAEQKVALTVVYDGQSSWQGSSFDALRRALRSAGGPDVPFTRA